MTSTSSKDQPIVFKNQQCIWKLLGKLDELVVLQHTSLDKPFCNLYFFENKSSFSNVLTYQMVNILTSPLLPELCSFLKGCFSFSFMTLIIELNFLLLLQAWHVI